MDKRWEFRFHEYILPNLLCFVNVTNFAKQKHHDFHHSAYAWLTTIEQVITAIKQDFATIRI